MNEDLTFYNRVLEQITLNKISMNKLERELGYPRNSLHNYKLGRKPSARRLIEIARYFSVSPEYLMGKDKISKEKDIENLFKELTDGQKKKLFILCEEWIVSRL